MIIRFTRRRTQSEDTGVAPRRSKKLAMLLMGGIVLVSQLLSPLQANAASTYDQTVSVTDKLEITNGSTTLDITNNYAGYMLNTLPTVTSNCTTGSGVDVSDIFLNAKHWSVVQSRNFDDSEKIVLLSYTKVEDVEPLEFFTAGVGTYVTMNRADPPNAFYMVLSLTGSNEVRRTCQSFSSAYQWYIASYNSTYDRHDHRPYVVNHPIAYPPGYEGQEVPDTAGPVTALRPNIVADVNNKHISIMSKRNNLIDGDYKIHWFITNATFDDPPPGYIPFSLEGYSLPDQYLDFDIPTLNETISIQANFVDVNGNELSPPEGYQFKPSLITLVPDGSIYSVDTDGMICDENDSCSYVDSEWEDEPCDLLNLGGCVANIWHYIQVVLGIEKTRGNPTGSPFVTFSTGTYGFTAVVAAPMSFINSLATPGGCTTIYFQNPIPGGDNMAFTCIRPLLASLGTVFTIYQTLILGFTAYWVGVRVLGLIMDAKRPHNDRIEVHDL